MCFKVLPSARSWCRAQTEHASQGSHVHTLMRIVLGSRSCPGAGALLWAWSVLGALGALQGKSWCLPPGISKGEMPTWKDWSQQFQSERKLDPVLTYWWKSKLKKPILENNLRVVFVKTKCIYTKYNQDNVYTESIPFLVIYLSIYFYIELILFKIQTVPYIWWLKRWPCGCPRTIRLPGAFSDGIWILGKWASFDPFQI